MGQGDQNRPHTPGRRDAPCDSDRNSEASPGNCNLSADRAQRALQCGSRTARSAGRPWVAGINTHPEFGDRVANVLAEELDLPNSLEAANHFEAKRSDEMASSSVTGNSRRSRSTLFNVANNIRWLGSGPRCGFYEVMIPDLQPGSSIMPGKVNPVMCESLMQASGSCHRQRWVSYA